MTHFNPIHEYGDKKSLKLFTKYDGMINEYKNPQQDHSLSQQV